jgi:HEAT repeat protein
MAELKGQAGESIPALVDAATTGPVEVRSEAVLALGQIGAAPADSRENRGLIVPTLLDALDDPDPAVQYRAAQALGLLAGKADTAAPKLRALLQNDDIALRHQAARALEAIAPETESGPIEEFDTTTQQVAALLSAVKDEDSAPQREAVRTLSNLGPAAIAALPDLAAQLASSEPAARRRVARSLQEVSSRALDETPALIRDLQAHGPEADRAAQALGELGENANLAQRDLLAALSDPDPEVRLIVAEVLGDISGAMSAVVGALLVESLDNDGEAIAALQRVSGLSGG